MKIEFWCDIVCPFCGLAEHRLESIPGMQGTDELLSSLVRAWEDRQTIQGGSNTLCHSS